MKMSISVSYHKYTVYNETEEKIRMIYDYDLLSVLSYHLSYQMINPNNICLAAHSLHVMKFQFYHIS